MSQSFFVILNGGEAVGKGTQKAKLLDLHPNAVQVREPGGTPEAEKIRFVILDKDASITERLTILANLITSGDISPLCKDYLEKAKDQIIEHGLDGVAEMYLYAASRAESNQKVVRKAKEEGKIILGDRSVACSMAYQGFARGIGMKPVWEVNKPTLEGAYPDLEIFLNLPLEESQKRLSLRTEKQDRLDLENNVFHECVRAGYLEYYKHHCPYPFEIIDASGTIEEVHEKIKKVIETYQK